MLLQLNQYLTVDLYILYSVIQACSLPNITFGHGSESDSGFLQQVSYDEYDWLFGSSTPTNDTGPDEDYTEDDTDGLFAYLEGHCDLDNDGIPDTDQIACESGRVRLANYN